jgi:phospholipid/cholesterol/gamma-HCH transport system permease protein
VLQSVAVTKALDSAAAGRWVSLETSGEGATLHLAGDWRLPSLAMLGRALQATRSVRPIVGVDGRALTALDTAGALVMLRHLQSLAADPAAIAFDNFTPAHRSVIDVVSSRLAEVALEPVQHRRGILAEIGFQTESLGRLLLGHLNFLGYVAGGVGSLLGHPWRLRRQELAAQFEQVGIRAIPVVALVTFLIGVVFAYLLGLQASRYGANIFVVDGVAIGMAREFAPILVAVIIAGRSGAAFTAQLGTMKLTEETDAIRVLGLSPMDVLILPRVFALVVALPLLVFVGNVLSNLGAMAMAAAMLDITPTTYLDRLSVALSTRHLWVGLAKAPVFALFIAVIGIRMGMTVKRDTRAIGINTTSTVVQGIVSVILLDALFAVIFQALEI